MPRSELDSGMHACSRAGRASRGSGAHKGREAYVLDLATTYLSTVSQQYDLRTCTRTGLVRPYASDDPALRAVLSC